MMRVSDSSYKQYLLIIVASSIAILSFIGFVGINGLFFSEIFGYQKLYAYQLNKIAKSEKIETIFVGDSSLGNSVNSKLFTELSGSKSFNISLTGLHGYAGSYNMLKKTITPTTKNVILMQSLDTLKRDVSYGGYLITISSLDDLVELNSRERGEVFNSFFKMVSSYANLKSIVKIKLGLKKEGSGIKGDYIKQGEAIKVSEPEAFNATINKEKALFLKKIITFCLVNDINLIHLHGPIQKKIGLLSDAYIHKVNYFLEQLKLGQNPNFNMIEDIALMDDVFVGDASDHVRPEYKDLYTKKYFKLLGKYLR